MDLPNRVYENGKHLPRVSRLVDSDVLRPSSPCHHSFAFSEGPDKALLSLRGVHVPFEIDSDTACRDTTAAREGHIAS